MIAYAWASGLIEFGARAPKGAIAVASGPAKAVRDYIEGVARHGYDTHAVRGRPQKIPGTERLIVPGVPEAADQGKAILALVKWTHWIAEDAPKGVTITKGVL